MNKTYLPVFVIQFLLILCLISACRSDVHQLGPSPMITINPKFQMQVSSVPTVPPYRCGAWASNNTPGAYATITIYAKLTKDITGTSDVPATAIVHFKSVNITLDQQPVSDGNGYVSFTLPLQGRQPQLIPATVDVKFATPASSVQCSAFFTPQ